jgi:hypothetical protein
MRHCLRHDHSPHYHRRESRDADRDAVQTDNRRGASSRSDRGRRDPGDWLRQMKVDEDDFG